MENIVIKVMLILSGYITAYFLGKELCKKESLEDSSDTYWNKIKSNNNLILIIYAMLCLGYIFLLNIDNKALIFTYSHITGIFVFSSIVDIKLRELPDFLSLWTFSLSFTVLMLTSEIGFNYDLLIKIIIFICVLLLAIFTEKIIGIGDVKLLATSILFININNGIAYCVIMIVALFPCAIFLYYLKKTKKRVIKEVPFGPFLVLPIYFLPLLLL